MYIIYNVRANICIYKFYNYKYHKIYNVYIMYYNI